MKTYKYTINLNGILEKRLEKYSNIFEIDKKELLLKIIVESLFRNNKTIMKNIFIIDYLDGKIDKTKIKEIFGD